MSAVWARWMGIFTGAGLLVGAATMVAAIFAAKYAKQAAHETRRSANITEAEYRPWLILRVSPGGDFAFAPNGRCTATIKLEMENVGKDAARKMTPWAVMYVGDTLADRNDAVRRVAEHCAGNLENPGYHFRTAAPGQIVPIQPDVVCAAVDDDIYRVVAYVAYEYPGCKERKFAWQLFDVFRENGNRIKRSDGNRLQGSWKLVPTGIGDAT